MHGHHSVCGCGALREYQAQNQSVCPFCWQHQPRQFQLLYLRLSNRANCITVSLAMASCSVICPSLRCLLFLLPASDSRSSSMNINGKVGVLMPSAVCGWLQPACSAYHLRSFQQSEMWLCSAQCRQRRQACKKGRRCFQALCWSNSNLSTSHDKSQQCRGPGSGCDVGTLSMPE